MKKIKSLILFLLISMLFLPALKAQEVLPAKFLQYSLDDFYRDRSAANMLNEYNKYLASIKVDEAAFDKALTEQTSKKNLTARSLLYRYLIIKLNDKASTYLKRVLALDASLPRQWQEQIKQDLEVNLEINVPFVISQNLYDLGYTIEYGKGYYCVIHAMEQNDMAVQDGFVHRFPTYQLPRGDLKVNYSGSKPTVTDFLDAFSEGYLEGPVLEARHCIKNAVQKPASMTLDIPNGYLHYSDGHDPENGIETCIWNCSDAKSKIIAFNLFANGPLYSQNLYFFRYNNATKTMKIIDAPFDRWPVPFDLLGLAKEEDLKKYINDIKDNPLIFTPYFILPHHGKDIVVQPGTESLTGEAGADFIMQWDGNGFHAIDAAIVEYQKSAQGKAAKAKADAAFAASEKKESKHSSISSSDSKVTPKKETTEDKVMNAVFNLPEVKNLKKASVMIASAPSEDEPYFTAQVGQNMDDHFSTVYWFHVYPTGNMIIKVYDVISDSEITLDQWRKQKK